MHYLFIYLFIYLFMLCLFKSFPFVFSCLCVSIPWCLFTCSATFKGEKKVTLVCKFPEGGFEISATSHDLTDFIDQIQKYGALSTEMDPNGSMTWRSND
jgi:hypothetical protein